MFPYHVRAFRHADDDDARLGTEGKFGRANQIADIFDEDQPDLAEIDFPACLSDKVGVKMTPIDRGNLHDRNAILRDLFGVVARRRVAVEDGKADAILEFLDQPGDQCRLARTNRPHHIDRGGSMLVEQSAIFIRKLCIRFEQTVLELDIVDFLRRRLRFGSYSVEKSLDSRAADD